LTRTLRHRSEQPKSLQHRCEQMAAVLVNAGRVVPVLKTDLHGQLQVREWPQPAAADRPWLEAMLPADDLASQRLQADALAAAVDRCVRQLLMRGASSGSRPSQRSSSLPEAWLTRPWLARIACSPAPLFPQQPPLLLPPLMLQQGPQGAAASGGKAGGQQVRSKRALGRRVERLKRCRPGGQRGSGLVRILACSLPIPCPPIRRSGRCNDWGRWSYLERRRICRSAWRRCIGSWWWRNEGGRQELQVHHSAQRAVKTG